MIGFDPEYRGSLDTTSKWHPNGGHGSELRGLYLVLARGAGKGIHDSKYHEVGGNRDRQRQHRHHYKAGNGAACEKNDLYRLVDFAQRRPKDNFPSLRPTSSHPRRFRIF